jgi:hypothetical protein
MAPTGMVVAFCANADVAIRTAAVIRGRIFMYSQIELFSQRYE